MVKRIRIGTYNVNNLFDRFDDPYLSSDTPWVTFMRTTPKKPYDEYRVGQKIRSSECHILAIQEVESLSALKDFVLGHTGKYYPGTQIISTESNDYRGIDLGLLSKYRLGRIISHRFRERTDGFPVFSRDCLQVEVIVERKSLPKPIQITFFICHLKSQYSKFEFGTANYENDINRSKEKRKLQVEETIKIVEENIKDLENDHFIILGDMNDTPDSEALKGFLDQNNKLKLVNAIEKMEQKFASNNVNPAEYDINVTHSKKLRTRDTHVWADSPYGRITSQLDYILLSPSLKNAFLKANVEHGKNSAGSDHYLFWVELDLEKM